MMRYVDGKRVFDSLFLEHIENQDHDQIEAVLSKNQGPHNQVDCYGATLLHYAAKFGNVILIRDLLQLGYFNVNATDGLGYTPLEISSANGHDNCTKHLLREGAKTRAKKFTDHIPVNMIIGSSADRETMVKRFASRHYYLPDIVAYSRDKDLAGNLISGGRAVDERDYLRGQTALHVAVQMIDVRYVQMLIARGADVNATDHRNETPLCRHDIRSHDTVEKLQIFMILLKNGAAIRECSKFLVAHYASRKSEIIMRLFLRSNIDLNLTYHWGMTILHLLVDHFDHSILKVLYDVKFDVNACGTAGFTALQLAVTKQCAKTVESLLDLGADSNVEGRQHSLPLLNAFYRKDETKTANDIIMLLLQYGANVQITSKHSTKHRLRPFETVFDYVISQQNYIFSQLAIAELALDESTGQSISPSILVEINNHDILREQFNVSKRQIEILKANVVNKAMTFYRLLTASDREIFLHAMDDEFSANFDSTLGTSQLYSYYYYTLLRRASRANTKVNGMKNIAYIFCKISGILVDKYHFVVDMIASYLHFHDFQSLEKV